MWGNMDTCVFSPERSLIRRAIRTQWRPEDRAAWRFPPGTLECSAMPWRARRGMRGGGRGTAQQGGATSERWNRVPCRCETYLTFPKETGRGPSSYPWRQPPRARISPRPGQNVNVKTVNGSLAQGPMCQPSPPRLARMPGVWGHTPIGVL